ncbi:MAG TPA: LacI family DNA-binding transcriptional regulator [Opitutaceae bacterium]|nr:LacI family DNA-binding transcriptional regulator [Opitutaceae bacterium]
MKTASRQRPVDLALSGYERLLRDQQGRTSAVFPSELELALRWGVSQSAVNRAAQRLIAAGRLRRQGYKLMPAAANTEAGSLTGARLVVITHPTARLTTLPEEATRRGVTVEEIFCNGRDIFRHNLRLAAQDRVDGVIFRLLGESGWEWDNEVAEFDRLRIPYVVCEEAPPGHNLVTEDLQGATASLVAHLSSLGHTNMVYLGSLRLGDRSTAIRQAYEGACLRLGMQDSARQKQELSAHTREIIRLSLRRIRLQYPAATALVLFDAYQVEPFLAAAKEEQIAIPRDLSLVCVGDSPVARNSQPSVTCAGFDTRTLGHTALDLLCQNMLEIRRTGRLLPRQRLRLEATLRLRASVAPRTTPSPAAEPGIPPGRSSSRRWPQARDQRLREAEESWQQPHRLAAGARPGSLAPLDLSGLANRSLSHQNGWLGHLPLLHFGPGRKSIHGVTFDVLDEHQNHGKGAIVLRSNRSLSTAGRVLPVEIAVPVRRRVRAVYFLHACGYAGEPMPFAWYDFYLAGRRPISVPLVARGLGDLPAGAPPPNIQDWWPDFPQFNGVGVRHLVITENGDPFDYERYLYTLEWANPFPEAELTTLYIRSNPALETTLALLALTLLVD